MKSAIFVGLWFAILALPMGASQAQTTDRPLRLLYMFSKDASSHGAQAQLLQQVWLSHRDQLQVEGFVRLQDAPEANGQLDDLRHGLDYQLAGLFHGDRDQVPDYLRPAVEGPDAYAVLLDADRDRVLEAGADLPQLLGRIYPGPVSTEVDESTWGKIKVLFE